MTDDRGQRSEGRRQITEVRGQRSDDRGQRTRLRSPSYAVASRGRMTDVRNPFTFILWPITFYHKLFAVRLMPLPKAVRRMPKAGFLAPHPSLTLDGVE